MVKRGFWCIAHFTSRVFKAAAWLGIHILKLLLAVLETILLLTGNLLKIMLIVFYAGKC